MAATTAIAADTLATPKQTALEREAAYYIRFREDIAAIEAGGIKDPNSTREAHKLLSAHEARKLSGGWVAYAALVAADTPAFAEALRRDMGNKKRREELLEGLRGNPRYMSTYPAAREAIAAVRAMAAADAKKIESVGELYKSNAYSLQKTAWGKQKISAPSARLQEARAFASGRRDVATPRLAASAADGVISPTLAAASPVWAPDWAGSGAGADRGESDAIVDRILNLATRYSLGQVNDKLVDAYARNDKANRCLEMRQMVFDQCMAATRAPYEEAFCLGEHGLNDVAGCIGGSSGGA